MKVVFVRGISGSGKSTKAREIAKEIGAEVLSADDFWMVDGEYKFDGGYLAWAHWYCKSDIKMALEAGKDIVIDNTFIRISQIEDYLRVVYKFDVEIEFAMPDWTPELYKDGEWNLDFILGRNIHVVPDEVVVEMAETFEWDISHLDIKKKVA